MVEDDNRDTVLAALRRARTTRESDVLAPFEWPAQTRSRATLVDRFVERAEAVQASVTVVRHLAQARERVTDIVRTLGCARPVVSEDARPLWDPASAGFAPAHTWDPASAGFAADVGITSAAYGLAETGTIVVCSGPAGGRVESLVPPAHIALLRASDIVETLPDLLAALERDRRFDQSSAVTFITGPSRTADIELTLTIGVHGPKQLFLVVVNDVEDPYVGSGL